MASGFRKRASGPGEIVNDEHPQLKRTKFTSSRSAAACDSDKRHTCVTGNIDANGDRYWEISKMRRVTISSFRGKTLVNIREYYEKDGQELPGKKVGPSVAIFLILLLYPANYSYRAFRYKSTNLPPFSPYCLILSLH